MTSTISVLVPVHNEEDMLPLFLRELEQVLEGLGERYRCHVLILDDGSRDRSAEVVREFDSPVYSLGLCRFTRNFGKEAAIAAGLERCESDVYVVMDGDLQHPPALLPEMLRQWEAGYKVVEGVKRDRGRESPLYRALSRTFYRLFHSLGKLDLENLSDFKLLDREVALAFRRMPERHRFFRALVGWMGYPTCRLPFEVPERRLGRSSWSPWRLFKFSVKAISSFSSLPLHLVTLTGLLMLLISVVLGSLTLYQWFAGEAVTGFTTVILLLLIIGSMLMVSLGLIGLYLSRIYDEIKGRPVYLVREEFLASPPTQTAEPSSQAAEPPSAQPQQPEAGHR